MDFRFAYMVIRPVSAPLDPPMRLRMWKSIYTRFFPWVWGFIVLLVVSGYLDMALHFRRLTAAPRHLLAMQAVGWIMIALFA